MSTLDEILQLASQLTQEQQEYIAQLINNMLDSVEPDEWGKEVIREWETKTLEERLDGAKSHEQLLQEIAKEIDSN